MYSKENFEGCKIDCSLICVRFTIKVLHVIFQQFTFMAFLSASICYALPLVYIVCISNFQTTVDYICDYLLGRHLHSHSKMFTLHCIHVQLFRQHFTIQIKLCVSHEHLAASTHVPVVKRRFAAILYIGGPKCKRFLNLLVASQNWPKVLSKVSK